MSMIVFRYLHFLGMAFWVGSAVGVALAAAAPTDGDLGVARALRKVTLWVTTPSMILAFIGGFGVLIPNFTAVYAKAGWMHGKLTLVILLAGATGLLTGRLRRWAAGEDVEPKTFMRLAWFMGITGLLVVTLAVFRPFS